MAVTSVVCPDCGSPVAPGRLSCQSCGMLLAAVVGSARRQPWAATPTDLPEIDEDRPLASARLVEPPAAADPDAVAQPADGPLPAVAATPAPKRGPRRLTTPKPKPPAGPAKARYVKAPPADATPLPPVDQTALFGPVPNVVPPPILHDWSDQADAPAERPTNGAHPAATRTPTHSTTGAPVAGSYLAPSATYVAPIAPRPAGMVAAVPTASVAASGVAWPDPERLTGAAAASTVVASHAPAREASARGLADWLVIGGSVLALVSFILPWASSGVIGSVGSEFTAEWGLANPGHLLMIVGVLAVLVLQIVSNPVPAWIRSAGLPILLGGILTGLAFAYFARPAGGGSGVAVLLAGALVMIGGGLLASRPERHGSGSPTV